MSEFYKCSWSELDAHKYASMIENTSTQVDKLSKIIIGNGNTENSVIVRLVKAEAKLQELNENENEKGGFIYSVVGGVMVGIVLIVVNLFTNGN